MTTAPASAATDRPAGRPFRLPLALAALALLAPGCPYEGDAPGECTDGVDNDRDGRVDCDDSACANAWDCGGGEHPGDDDAADDDDSASPSHPREEIPAVEVVWGPWSLELIVAGGPGNYWFGMAEAGDECGLGCWQGEDCLIGDTDTETGAPLGPYCHDAGDVGAVLAYGGDPLALQPGTTAFDRDDHDADIAFYLRSRITDGCWVWHQGEAHPHYDGLDCGAPDEL